MKRYFLVLVFFLQAFNSSFLFSQHSTSDHPSNPWENPLFSGSSQEHPTAYQEGETFQSKFVRMLVILALLIGFMILAAWTLKRMMKTRVNQLNVASSIKVLETRTLSPRSTLYLIEVEGQNFLIAESPNMVSHLASFDVSSHEMPR